MRVSEVWDWQLREKAQHLTKRATSRFHTLDRDTNLKHSGTKQQSVVCQFGGWDSGVREKVVVEIEFDHQGCVAIRKHHLSNSHRFKIKFRQIQNENENNSTSKFTYQTTPDQTPGARNRCSKFVLEIVARNWYSKPIPDIDARN